MSKTRTTVARRKARAALNPLNPTAVYARRKIEAFAARVRAEGQVVVLTCPACGAEAEVAADDLTTEKTCGACGHTWTPSIGDYAAGLKRGEAARQTRPSSMAAVVSSYYGGAR